MFLFVVVRKLLLFSVLILVLCSLCFSQDRLERDTTFDSTTKDHQIEINAKNFNWNAYNAVKFGQHTDESDDTLLIKKSVSVEFPEIVPIKRSSEDEEIDSIAKDINNRTALKFEGMTVDKDLSAEKLELLRSFYIDTPDFKPHQEKATFNRDLIRQKYFDGDNENDDDDSEKFKWGSAIGQMWIMQGVQHAYAVVLQEKTQNAIKNGPFVKDYFRSLKRIHGWDDGNKFFTNYIAHPMQGAISGFVYLQNNPKHKDQEFSFKKEYWDQRFKAFLWSTFWSTNWELGPISQSSLGNVGLYGHMGFVDLVITPTVGTTLMITEEAIDHYFIKKIESKGMTAKILSRMLLNPSRTMANLLRFKEPWYRDRSHK